MISPSVHILQSMSNVCEIELCHGSICVLMLKGRTHSFWLTHSGDKLKRVEVFICLSKLFFFLFLPAWWNKDLYIIIWVEVWIKIDLFYDNQHFSLYIYIYIYIYIYLFIGLLIFYLSTWTNLIIPVLIKWAEIHKIEGVYSLACQLVDLSPIHTTTNIGHRKPYRWYMYVVQQLYDSCMSVCSASIHMEKKASRVIVVDVRLVIKVAIGNHWLITDNITTTLLLLSCI